MDNSFEGLEVEPDIDEGVLDSDVTEASGKVVVDHCLHSASFILHVLGLQI